MSNRIITNSLQEYIKKRIYLAVFIFGLVVGTIAINILDETYHDKIIVTGKHYSEMMSYIEIDKGNVFINSVQNYVKEFVIILLLNFFFIGRIYNYMYLIIKGMGIGIILSSYVLSYGLKGLYIYIVSIFPHYLIYIPAIIIVIGSGISIRNIILDNEARNERYGISNYSFNDFIRIVRRVIIYFIVALLVAISISFVEAYINIPIFRKTIFSA